MYLAYSLLTLILFVVVSPYFVYQALRHNKYVGSFGQRLGYLPVSLNLDGDESIWVHAVSVGEVLAAIDPRDDFVRCLTSCDQDVHGVNLLVLPAIGRLFTLNRRLDMDTPEHTEQ